MGKANRKLTFTYNEDGICSLKYDDFIIYKGRDIDKGISLLKTYTTFIKHHNGNPKQLLPGKYGKSLYDKYI